MKKTFLLLILIFNFIWAFAQQTEVVSVNANKMDKNVNNTIIKPLDYSTNNQYPVLYLLHGHGGNNQDWINIVPQIKQYATQYQLIIVCPDGANSWYLDSPINPSSQYESYIVQDLVPYIDSHYSTINHKNGRGITGLSMGGHGALYLAIRNKTVFGMAGSMSGGVDLTYNPDAWDKSLALGSYQTNVQLWKDNSVVNMVETLQNNDLKLLIDCGIADFFYGVNLSLHDKLVAKGINHDFTIRPGEHNWTYWANAIKYQLLFFKTQIDDALNTWTPDGQLLFHDSSTDDFYDPSWTYVNAPSLLPEMTGKFKVETTTKKAGSNALRLKWKSTQGGDWGACIAATGWAVKDLNKAISVSFWIYSQEGIAKNLLPSVHFQNAGYAISARLKLKDYLQTDLVANTWTNVTIPINDFKTASPTFNLSSTKSLFFDQDATDDVEHTIYIDEIVFPNDPNYSAPTYMTLFENSASDVYYDQSWINVVAPSNVTQATGNPTKFPVETILKKEGTNSLKLSWTSSVGGNWDAIIASIGWNSYDLTNYNYVQFWVYSPAKILKSEMPKISLETTTNIRTGKVLMEDFSIDIEPNTWTLISIPVSAIWAANPSFVDKNKIKGIFFHQNNADNINHTLYIDQIVFNTTNNAPNAIPNNKISNINIGYQSGILNVQNYIGQLQVYSISGKQITSFESQNEQSKFKLNITKGVYIIKTGNENTKIIIN